ncbi:MAG: hypothetical protein CL910_02300 [Deltaproteobacteria bacterium]|jgi:hypothetical protein|nr:hypothetical protein [Deltaproteobacteria bacterium]
MDLFSQLQRRANRLIQSQPWVLFATPVLFAGGAFGLHWWLAEFLQAPFGTAAARDLGEGIGTFLTVIGIIYALILGFTFQQAFSRQIDLRSALRAEASSLWNLLLLGRAMGGAAQRGEIDRRVRAYVGYVLGAEFPPDEREPVEAAPMLFEILGVLHGLSADGVGDEVDRVTLAAIHDELRAATRARSDRLAISTRAIPRIHWFQIELLSTLVMIGFLLLDLQAPPLEALLLGLTASAITVLYMSLFDLDYPFAGLWRVEPKPLEALVRELDEPAALDAATQ